MLSDITVSHELNGVDWQAVASLIERAPLVRRQPEQLRRAFENSYAACFAYAATDLVGTARAVSDGVYYATVLDVCVDPDYQGRGIGRAIMRALLSKLPFDKIFLTAVPGKEGFYRKLGFLRQTNAMGLYAEVNKAEALRRGVLVEGALPVWPLLQSEG